MIFQSLAILPVLILAASSLIILTTQNSRRALIVLGAQYLAAFWLTALSWPVGLALVKLVVGVVCVIVLATSQEISVADARFTALSGRVFRSLAAGLVWMLVLTIAPPLEIWLVASPEIVIGGLLLVGMGLLQLGMTTQALRVILGLLTFLSGFEVLYAVVESSVLVTGLLAVVNLGLALAGAYLLAETPVEQTE